MKIEKSSETIFIVDNSVQQKIKSLIEEKYNNIIHFYKIDEIIKLIKLQQPALIILNINSKEYDEISFLKKISTLEIPIILCGVKEISVIKNAYKLGVVDVIKEPFLKEELYFKIDLWIDNRKKQKESNHSSLLLQEYKDAVDESSIVSKTNNKGIITYVNEQFCLLSGYKKEELIGKNHNIVRHPDTPKKVFEEIWNTIKNKKIAWKGKIKNKKKMVHIIGLKLL